MPYANKKGADQPAHSRSLISTFVFRCLDSLISLVSISEITSLLLASARGSKPTATVLCPWARHFTPQKYWLITQEAMAPSRHDWKIVDWDVKPQHNQHNQPKIASLGSWAGRFKSGLAANTEDRFSRDVAQFINALFKFSLPKVYTCNMWNYPLSFIFSESSNGRQLT